MSALDADTTVAQTAATTEAPGGPGAATTVAPVAAQELTINKMTLEQLNTKLNED